MTTHLAVDLGASSGRVSLVRITEDHIRVHEVHRFRHTPLRWPDGWHWNLPEIFNEVLAGIRLGVRANPDVISVGVDSWGVDYGLLDAAGGLLGLPFTHRDPRTRGHAPGMADEELYQRTGVLNQDINTSLQLLSEPRPGRVDVATTLLFIPDLVNYLLTGRAATERSIASTSQMLGTDGEPDLAVLEAIGVPHLFPRSISAGSTIGDVDPSLLEHGTGPLPLRQVAAHDTASAYATVAGDDEIGFVSCGTWGIAGVASDEPVLTEAARLGGFTNEHTADGRFMFVRNLTGLWLLSETLTGWGVEPSPAHVADVVAEAATRPAFRYLIDAGDPQFLTPGEMSSRIREACVESGQGDPGDRASIVRCILDSIAAGLAAAVADAARVAGQPVRRIHLVGGGSQIPLLAQSIADRSGVQVLAGPAEATTIGNALLQAVQRPRAGAAHVAAALGGARAYVPGENPERGPNL